MAWDTIALMCKGNLAGVGESARNRLLGCSKVDLGHTLGRDSPLPLFGRMPGGARAAAFLRVGGAEPGPRVHRFAALANLEVQLRAAAAAAVARRCDGVPGGYA